MKRKIYIGADSAGYELKEVIKEHLNAQGYDIDDCGSFSSASCHYPEFAVMVSQRVQWDLQGSFGILICGTGIGMSMAANKVKGIRAAVCTETFAAKYTRLHNDANVLCMGARVIGEGVAIEITDTFITTEFEGGKHKRRIDMFE